MFFTDEVGKKRACDVDGKPWFVLDFLIIRTCVKIKAQL